MVRVLGVRIPSDKPLYIALTYLYGVGRRRAIETCLQLGLDPQVRAGQLSEEELSRLGRTIEQPQVHKPVQRSQSDGTHGHQPHGHQPHVRAMSRIDGARRGEKARGGRRSVFN